MLKAGLVSATCKDLDVQTVIDLAVRLGLQGIEWSENWHIKEGDVAQATIVRDLCREAGLDCVALGSYYRLGTSADFSTRLRVAHALGAPVIRIWAGEKASQEVSEEERELLIEETRSLALQAEELGIIVATEWHRNTLTDTNESGISLLDSVQRPNCKTLWQPTPTLSVPERIAGLKALGERLVNFHVYHWDATGRRPLQEGVEEWKKYFSLVDPTEERYALLEFVQGNTIEQLEEDAATLIGLLHERKNSKS